IDATRHVMTSRAPDLTLAYLPHLDDDGKKAHHLDHPRSRDLVAVAEPDAWFTYNKWHDHARPPAIARLVDNHPKPG
ncbi:alkaline phosphatase family protein, partial [Streptomyces caniscabiei]